MDPTAQVNSQDPAAGADPINPGPIQPGQFVVAEQASQQQPPPYSVPESKSEQASPYMPPINPPAAGSPEELLQNISQASGGKSPDFTPPTAPANEPLPPNSVITPMAETLTSDLPAATP